MKKLFAIIGIIFLSIVILLNICFTAFLDASEHITINNNNILYVLGLVLVGILIYFLTNFINKILYKDDKRKKLRKWLFIAVISIYIIADILWTIFVRSPIVGDQVHVACMGQLFARGYDEEILQSMTYANISLKDYMQAYNQQIPQAFIYGLFFKLMHSDKIEILRIINVFAIIAIITAIYIIGNVLSKKYKVNKVLLLTLMLTFISLPMLSTFVYGDLPSLALSLFCVYYMMKYTEYKKLKYALIASIFSMLGYMMRMNSLIFIIATVIYLLFNLFNKITTKTAKENVINLLVIVAYVIISIIPSQIVDNYYINKYDLDKSKTYPTISYFLLAMEEGPRGNGWYIEGVGEPALKDPQGIKEEYMSKIKERLEYFSENLWYTFNFYTKKLASMWTENTYAAIRNNTSKENDPLENLIAPLTFYQKVLLIISCICSIIVLIQNRKNLTPELIYLLLIFMGGFAFHIIWEAKSRYIIPYIVVLIPIASIKINKIRRNKNGQ